MELEVFLIIVALIFRFFIGYGIGLLIIGLLAKRKNRSCAAWALWGGLIWIFGPVLGGLPLIIGLVILMFMKYLCPTCKQPISNKDYKEKHCPHCAKEKDPKQASTTDEQVDKVVGETEVEVKTMHASVEVQHGDTASEKKEPFSCHKETKPIPKQTLDVQLNLANCPHCQTKGVLPMADNRCPHCKKELPI